MDRFFDGAFLTFGLEVIAFAERDQVKSFGLKLIDGWGFFGRKLFT